MNDSLEASEAVPPHVVAYRGVPEGEVHATEGAVTALSRTRPWAIMAGVVLLAAGGMASLGGTALLVIYALFYGRPGWNDVTPVNLVLGSLGLLYGLPLVVAGVLLMMFVRAAGRTTNLRRPEDLERAMIALMRFWRWAALILLAVLCTPFVVMGLAVVTGAWD